MTLLSICQNAADEVQLARPAAVATASTPTERRLLRYANKVGDELMRMYYWQELRTEQTFTATAGELQSGVLPSDFDRFIPETFWDRTNDRMIVGPITAVEWNGLKAHDYEGWPRKFIHRGDSIRVVPDFGGSESCAFEYISNQWCESSGGTGQTSFQADTDVARLDEELITRGVILQYLLSEGLPAGHAERDYRGRLRQLQRNDRPRAGILVTGDIFRSGGRHFGGVPPVSGNEDLTY